MLPPSLHPAPYESPYWIPLMGSSGSTSPSSILVSIMRASRPKISSTASPVKALASITTGTPAVLAQVLVSALLTSLPSGATVALCRVPADIDPEWPRTVPSLSAVVTVLSDAELGAPRNDPPIESTLPVNAESTLPEGRDVSTRGAAEARSSLLPTRRTESCGEARWRASFRKGATERNEACEVRS